MLPPTNARVLRATLPSIASHKLTTLPCTEIEHEVRQLTSTAGFHGVGYPGPLSVLWHGLARRGAGFIEHIETADTCRERFEAWLENISGDMGSTWTG
ncbi:DUF7501 family protein [Halogranum rubrum]